MKLYILIQQLLRRKFVQYFVLFFILISIIAVIASSFEEMATYKVLLFGITYVSSFIFLIEYTARIVSAPALFRTDTDMASLPVPVYPVERETSPPVLRVKAVGQQAVVPAGIPEDVEIGTAVQTFPAACQTAGRKYHPFVSHGFSN